MNCLYGVKSGTRGIHNSVERPNSVSSIRQIIGKGFNGLRALLFKRSPLGARDKKPFLTHLVSIVRSVSRGKRSFSSQEATSCVSDLFEKGGVPCHQLSFVKGLYSELRHPSSGKDFLIETLNDGALDDGLYDGTCLFLEKIKEAIEKASQQRVSGGGGGGMSYMPAPMPFVSPGVVPVSSSGAHQQKQTASKGSSSGSHNSFIQPSSKPSLSSSPVQTSFVGNTSAVGKPTTTVEIGAQTELHSEGRTLTVQSLNGITIPPVQKSDLSMNTTATETHSVGSDAFDGGKPTTADVDIQTESIDGESTLENQRLQRELDSLNEEYRRFKEQSKGFSKAVTDRLLLCMRENATLSLQLSKMETSLKEKEAELARLSQEMKTAKGIDEQKYQQLLSKYEALKAEFARLTAEYESILEGMTRSQEEIASLKEELAKPSSSMEPLMHDAEREKEALLAEYERFKEGVNRLFSTFSEVFSKALDALESRLANLQNQVSHFRIPSPTPSTDSGVDAGTATDGFFEPAPDQWLAEKESLEALISELKAQQAALEDDFSRLKKRFDDQDLSYRRFKEQSKGFSKAVTDRLLLYMQESISLKLELKSLAAFLKEKEEAFAQSLSNSNVALEALKRSNQDDSAKYKAEIQALELALKAVQDTLNSFMKGFSADNSLDRTLAFYDNIADTLDLDSSLPRERLVDIYTQLDALNKTYCHSGLSIAGDLSSDALKGMTIDSLISGIKGKINSLSEYLKTVSIDKPGDSSGIVELRDQLEKLNREFSRIKVNYAILSRKNQELFSENEGLQANLDSKSLQLQKFTKEVDDFYKECKKQGVDEIDMKPFDLSASEDSTNLTAFVAKLKAHIKRIRESKHYQTDETLKSQVVDLQKKLDSVLLEKEALSSSLSSQSDLHKAQIAQKEAENKTLSTKNTELVHELGSLTVESESVSGNQQVKIRDLTLRLQQLSTQSSVRGLRVSCDGEDMDLSQLGTVLMKTATFDESILVAGIPFVFDANQEWVHKTSCGKQFKLETGSNSGDVCLTLDGCSEFYRLGDEDKGIQRKYGNDWYSLQNDGGYELVGTDKYLYPLKEDSNDWVCVTRVTKRVKANSECLFQYIVGTSSYYLELQEGDSDLRSLVPIISRTLPERPPSTPTCKLFKNGHKSHYPPETLVAREIAFDDVSCKEKITQGGYSDMIPFSKYLKPTIETLAKTLSHPKLNEALFAELMNGLLKSFFDETDSDNHTNFRAYLVKAIIYFGSKAEEGNDPILQGKYQTKLEEYLSGSSLRPKSKYVD